MTRLAMLILAWSISFSARADSIEPVAAIEDSSREQLISELDDIRHRDGPFAPAALRPLTRLGIIALHQQDYEGAIDYFKQGQNVLHRAEGVYTMTQSRLLDLMMQASVSSNRLEFANSLIEFKYELYKRNLGEADPRSVAVLISLADWYQAGGLYAAARREYEHAINLLKASGATGQQMMRPITALAYNDYLEGRCCASDLLADITSEVLADGETRSRERAQALILAGDINLMSDAAEEAEAYYREAQQQDGRLLLEPVLLGISTRDRMMRAYKVVFSRQTVSRRPRHEDPIPPGQLVGSPMPFCEARVRELAKARDYHDFYISFELTVTPSGRAREVEVIDTNVPFGLRSLAKRMLQLSRFRPGLDAGAPVARRVRIEQRFSTNVKLQSSDDPFPPANLAVFHSCHGLAASL